MVEFELHRCRRGAFGYEIRSDTGSLSELVDESWLAGLSNSTTRAQAWGRNGVLDHAGSVDLMARGLTQQRNQKPPRRVARSLVIDAKVDELTRQDYGGSWEAS